MTNFGLLRIENLTKSFLLHTHGGVRLPVLRGLSLSVGRGECVGLSGASGSGKSTLLRCLHGNYLADSGSIFVLHRGGWIDLTRAAPHEILDVRRATLGYVSQFLRVIPRMSALRVVAEPLLDLGVDEALANEKAAALLARLQIPERLWSLSPTSFSGGEKQRVNLARSLVVDAPILLLDEPTSALDARGREIVTEIILERRAAGAAIVGVLHDEAAMERICTRRLDLEMEVARG